MRRGHGHSDALEYMDLSCEEGEETASSEGHSEVLQASLSSQLGSRQSSSSFARTFVKPVAFLHVRAGKRLGRQ